MTRIERLDLTLNDLEIALETYGGDRTRWPAPMRHGLAALIAAEPKAGRMVREAEALDRLLDQAPAGGDDVALAALVERISAAAAREPHAITGSSPALQRTDDGSRSVIGFNRRRPTQRYEYGLAGAALAASLVLGIFVGQSPVITPAAEYLIGTGSGEQSGQQMAIVDEAEGILDEDLL